MVPAAAVILIPALQCPKGCILRATGARIHSGDTSGLQVAPSVSHLHGKADTTSSND
jgi:hypothetical protein